jgi:hypothetical protein
MAVAAYLDEGLGLGVKSYPPNSNPNTYAHYVLTLTASLLPYSLPPTTLYRSQQTNINKHRQTNTQTNTYVKEIENKPPNLEKLITIIVLLLTLN